MNICFVDIFKDPQIQVELGKYVVIAGNCQLGKNMLFYNFSTAKGLISSELFIAKKVVCLKLYFHT